VAKLNRIGHKLVYKGVEDGMLAEKAGQALMNLGLTSLNRQELAELFAEDGELPIEATVIDAELLRENFARIGFDAEVVRDTGASAESPYVEYKRSSEKVVSGVGLTGVVSFGIVWTVALFLVFVPIPFISMFALSLDLYSYLWPLSLLMSAVLTVTGGYFVGCLMAVYNYKFLMGLLIGIVVGVIQVACLAGSGSMAAPVFGSILIGVDQSLKGADPDSLPIDARPQARRLLSKPLLYFICSHLMALAATIPSRFI